MLGVIFIPFLGRKEIHYGNTKHTKKGEIVGMEI